MTKKISETKIVTLLYLLKHYPELKTATTIMKETSLTNVRDSRKACENFERIGYCYSTERAVFQAPKDKYMHYRLNKDRNTLLFCIDVCVENNHVEDLLESKYYNETVDDKFIAEYLYRILFKIVIFMFNVYKEKEIEGKAKDVAKAFKKLNWKSLRTKLLFRLWGTNRIAKGIVKEIDIYAKADRREKERMEKEKMPEEFIEFLNTILEKEDIEVFKIILKRSPSLIKARYANTLFFRMPFEFKNKEPTRKLLIKYFRYLFWLYWVWDSTTVNGMNEIYLNLKDRELELIKALAGKIMQNPANWGGSLIKKLET